MKSLGTSYKRKSGSTSIGLDVDGSTTFDKLKLVNTLNEFCHNSSDGSQHFLFIFFSFSLLIETEVCKMLKGLSLRKATGLMTYLQDLFVTVSKVLPTLFHTILICF